MVLMKLLADYFSLLISGKKIETVIRILIFIKIYTIKWDNIEKKIICFLVLNKNSERQ